MSSIKPGHGLLVVALLSALAGPAATAQNLDQNKPAPKLFTDTCAACHKSPRGLAKGRFRLTLYMFLRDHYASNSDSAWALTNYLDSLEGEKKGTGRASKKPATATTARSSLRPPAPVPTR